jgi:hypothetical protein
MLGDRQTMHNRAYPPNAGKPMQDSVFAVAMGYTQKRHCDESVNRAARVVAAVLATTLVAASILSGAAVRRVGLAARMTVHCMAGGRFCRCTGR